MDADSTQDDSEVQCDNQVTSQHMDSFDEVYKTYELTDFDLLLSRSIGRTSSGE